jgi:dihydroorotate dehydrogenase (fumarate)
MEVDMPALTTTYLGLPLKNPFILGASPLSGNVDSVRRCVDNGCSAIVMHSLFAERIPPVLSDAPRPGTGVRGGPSGRVAPSGGPVPLGPDEYLDQVRRITSAVDVPVIGSLNSTRLGDWLDYAPLLEQAGASAIELNVYDIVADANESSVDVEQRVESVVRSLKKRVRIPVAVKLTPFYSAFANFAMRLDAAGADGLVLFNRFYQPDVDVDTLESLPNIHLSTSAELPLRLHWGAILSGRVRASLAIVGGVHTALDVVKALLSGADAVQTVSAVLEEGPERFRALMDGLRQWMRTKGYDQIDAFRGTLSLSRRINPTAFERESYLRVLETWGR